MRKALGVMAVACLALSLAGCSLLPEEEVYQTAPIARTYVAPEYTLALTTRGDLQRQKKISCTYQSVRTEALSFPIDGEYVDRTFVETGDEVHAGDLLAQLAQGTLDAQIAAAQADIETLDRRISFAQEDYALALRRAKILRDTETAAENRNRVAAIDETYIRQAQALADQRTLKELELTELTEKRNERRLVAGIDGTVTYVREVTEGMKSTRGERFVSLADASQSAFRMATEEWARFQPGDEYEVTVLKESYPVVVCDPATLGLAAETPAQGEDGVVYLLLQTPSFELESGDRGTLVLTLDARTDVLYVPVSAIDSLGGRTVVYLLDEQGMKQIRYVTTGLDTGTYVEIVDGLSEGEAVVVK